MIGLTALVERFLAAHLIGGTLAPHDPLFFGATFLPLFATILAILHYPRAHRRREGRAVVARTVPRTGETGRRITR